MGAGGRDGKSSSSSSRQTSDETRTVVQTKDEVVFIVNILCDTMESTHKALAWHKEVRKAIV